MKKCTKCGRVLDESHFSKQARGKNHLRPWCKDCCNEYAKEYTRKKKIAMGERNISRVITNNMVDDIFNVKNLKDIPTKIKKSLKLPKKLLEDNISNHTIRSNITNVLRRSQSVVHISQIQVAYYRMFGELIKSRALSLHLNHMKKKDSNLMNVSKGYYSYKREE